MNFKVEIDIDIIDKDGNRVFHDKREANSFVRCMIDVLYGIMMYSWPTNGILDITNTQRTGTSHAYNMNVGGAAGQTTLGIVLGTGTNPVTIGDYALQTLLAEGSGSGQLNYQAQATDTTPNTSGSTRSFVIKRQVINNSGADITVNEIGLYCYAVATANYYGMLDRTLSTFTILSLATAVIKYTISVTV